MILAIAGDVDIAHATVFGHFKTREAIFRHTITQFTGRIAGLIEEGIEQGFFI